MRKIKDKANWKPKFRINRFNSEKDYKAGKLASTSEFDGNKLTNAGINELWTLIAGTGGTKFDTGAYLIVGTGSGAENASDVEGTFTAGVKVKVETGYPTYGTNQKVTYKAVFNGSVANQAWNEFGVLNKQSSGVLLNRKVSNQGTKISGQVWELELEITMS